MRNTFWKTCSGAIIDEYAITEMTIAMKTTRRMMSRVLNSFSSTVAINLPSTFLLRNMATATTTNNAIGIATSREGIAFTIN